MEYVFAVLSVCVLVLVYRFTLRIARRTIYYIYQIIYPCMTMSMLTLVVFYLPPGASCPRLMGTSWPASYCSQASCMLWHVRLSCA